MLYSSQAPQNGLIIWSLWRAMLRITKTCLFKYIENFTSKNWKFSNKNSDILLISAQNIDCGHSLEPPRRGGSNEYPLSMFLSRNKKNNVYPCKPQFYYMGFKGVKIYRHVFVMVIVVFSGYIHLYFVNSFFTCWCFFFFFFSDVTVCVVAVGTNINMAEINKIGDPDCVFKVTSYSAYVNVVEFAAEVGDSSSRINPSFFSGIKF